MKPFLTRVLRLCAVWAAGLVLSGCAALQVDVDVYKGPLANTDETQQAQLASMALSARPLVLTMRNLLLDDLDLLNGTVTAVVTVAAADGTSRTESQVRQTKAPLVAQTVTQSVNGQTTTKQVTVNLRDNHINTENWDRFAKTLTYSLEANSCEAVKLRNAKQLNGVLSFYEDRQPMRDQVDWDPTGWGQARRAEGIQTLARRLIDAPEANKAATNEAYRRLESMLVDFAARIQFYATNSWLIDECAQTSGGGSPRGYGSPEGGMPAGAISSSLKDASKRIKPLLETVANTIFVQADEMRRKSQHATQQGNYGTLEWEAARAAFTAGPHRVYEQMLQELALLEREKPSQPSPASPQAVTTELSDAALLALQTVVAGARAPAEKSASLARTLGKAQAPAPLEAAHKAVTVLRIDTLPAWLRDGAAIEALNPPNATTTLPQLKDSLAKWLGDEIAIYPAAGVPRHTRLVAAQQALATLTFSATARTLAWPTALQEMRNAVASKFAEQYRHYQGRALELNEALGPSTPVVTQAARPAAPQAAVGTADIKTAEDAKAVRQLIAGVRADVLRTLGPGSIDARAVPTQVREALEAARSKLPQVEGKPDAAAAAPYDKAIAYARQFRVSASSIPTLATTTQTLHAKPIDVVDSLIAVLRHQHLEAIQRSGKDSEDATRIAEAMTQALEYRKSMVYIRPSSTYLRSALPSTFAQVNPRLGWSNMLMDTIKNLSKATQKDPEQDVREELDKAFWQNINTVRVNASGSSNFVLAKDDVGNWYVKAMGADPKAMINAAKNLALFNAGGKFNVNLLRMNELETKLDDDKYKDDVRRDEWRGELRELKDGSGSFGATAERETTLALFRRNYDDSTRADASALRLALPGVPDRIKARWQETFRDDPARLASAQALMAAPDLSYSAVTASLADSTATTPLPAQIVKALRNVASYQSALAARVRGDATMTAPENASVTAAINDARAKAGLQEAAGKTATEQARQVADLEQQLANAPPDQQDAVRQKLNTARTQSNSAIQEWQTATVNFNAAQAELASRRNALAAARDRQSRAAADVGRVTRPLIAESASKRLRAVQSLESAANVVGRREP